MRRRIGRAALAAALLASLVVLVPASPAHAQAINVTDLDDEVDFGDGVISLREGFIATTDDPGESHLHLAYGETYVLDRCAGPQSGALSGGDDSDLHIHGTGSTIVQTCPGEGVIDHVGTGRLFLHDITVVGGEVAGGVTSVGPVEVEHSILRDNATDDPAGAGAVHSGGEVVVRRSLLEGGTAPDGGAAVRAAGKITVDQSAIVGNDSGTGAAISSAGAIDVFNSTLTGNTSTGGAPSAVESTGTGTVRLTSNTIAANTGPQIGRSTTATVQLRANAIVDPRSGANCAFSPPATSQGWNHSTDASCDPGANDVSNGASPSFRPLFRTGGVVPGLHPLAPDPLLDQIPSNQTPRPVDQRGVTRPKQGTSDIGAIEVVSCSGFTDMTASSPFCREVGWLAGAGITTGNPDGSFRPGDAVTRGSMAAFLNRLDGERWGPEVRCSRNGPFPDVPGNNAFCTHVLWLVDTGITAGYPDGTYRPNQGVTRGAMAAFMYRLAGSPDGPSPTCTTAAFPDVPASDPFCGHITWLVDEGITAGYPDGSFKPGDPVGRGAMAAFMYRLGGGVLP